MKTALLESKASAPESASPSAAAQAEPLAVLAARAAGARDRSIQRLVQASDQNLGHLETQAASAVRELLRQAVARGAQAKAAAALGREDTAGYSPPCRTWPRCSPAKCRSRTPAPC